MSGAVDQPVGAAAVARQFILVDERAGRRAPGTARPALSKLLVGSSADAPWVAAAPVPDRDKQHVALAGGPLEPVPDRLRNEKHPRGVVVGRLAPSTNTNDRLVCGMQ
jgi:hypothetical protein